MSSNHASAEAHYESIHRLAEAKWGDTTWCGDIQNCDVCSRPMLSETYMIDGPCQAGNWPMWAILCVVCAYKTAPTIAWGKAQLYKRDGADWRLVAGGPPIGEDGDF